MRVLSEYCKCIVIVCDCSYGLCFAPLYDRMLCVCTYGLACELQLDFYEKEENDFDKLVLHNSIIYIQILAS